MNELLAQLVPALAAALLHFLWQGLLIGLVAAAALALLGNARPQARYAVACGALLACVLWPGLTLLQAVVQADAAAPVAALAYVAADASGIADVSVLGEALHTPRLPPLPWIVALWAAGVLVCSLRMAGGLLWVRHLCDRAQLATGAEWQACTQRLAARMGIRLTVALRISAEGDSPVTAGWRRPVVLLPVALLARMPAELVEALIAHELAHIRRHDYLVNLLQGAVETLLFYHPVVWWLSRRIRIERELVADGIAAAALGEPRRLAIALSELDRHAGVRSPTPQTRFAPAAHGGHLMSRIRQLVRPERRAVGKAAALPLIGLAVAGAAFYAQARLAAPPVTATPTHVAAPAPSPTLQPVADAASRAAIPASPAPAQSAHRMTASDDAAYALVRKGQDGFSLSGSNHDIDGIEIARKHIDGDFIWFRRDGKAWIVSDPNTVSRAHQAWAATDALGEEMEGLSRRMEPHSERMQALSKRMEAVSADNAFETPEVRAASEEMEALGARMRELGEQQARLALQSMNASDAERDRLHREQETLSQQQESLSVEMERHAAVMEAAGKRMEAQYAPMEALGKEMEAAGKPMEAIGKDMETLGAKIEREAEIAGRQVRKLIDEAYAGGQARPAPEWQ
ncbi:M56 family metallopeptidase [Luteimonas sp. SDU82]|uniref:M56 family metallopeptidase n=1 Tax=Luteimonas sp. SDU82 TaxID=3422592 RepID=UPI003EB99130